MAAVEHGAERRSRLRQYQVQLLERVQAAKNGAQAGAKELGVLIGARRCLLDLTQVGEIVAAAALCAVPRAQDWYLGLANIRGNLTGVVDLARYRGEEAAPAAARGADGVVSVVTFAPGLGFHCALLVDGVLGLRDVAAMTALAPDGGAPAWAARAYDDAAAQRWFQVDLALLVREPGFLQIGF